MPEHEMNSLAWWETYFAESWSARDGSGQTRHFMERLIANLPEAERNYLQSNPATVLDWGCAFGEGADALAQAFPLCAVAGSDFASRAVEQARRQFPRQEFLLTPGGAVPRTFDVIVNSNCLEHFPKPLEVLRSHLALCRQFYVVLVPANESPLIECHRLQFRQGSFPEQIEDFQRICCKEIDVDRRYWGGRQFLVIYASRAYRSAQAAGARANERKKWDAFYEAHPEEPEDPGVRTFCENLATHIAALLPDGARILEAGCGGGWQSLALARLGRFEVHLMDFSAPALRSARRAFERAGQTAEFHLDDVFRKGQPQYDLVFNSSVLEHYAFPQQVDFLAGMASRSRGYVLAMVPNTLCYWYWIWRIKAAAEGNWPYGSETPVSDFSRAFQTAGLRFLGGAFLGEEWTEGNIRAIADLPPGFREEVLTIHRSPALLPEHNAYLYAGLGAVTPQLHLPAGSVFRPAPSTTGANDPRQQAMFADLLAMLIRSRSTQRETPLQLAEAAKERAALLERLREREQLLTASRVAESASRTEIERLQTRLAEKGAEAQRLFSELDRLYRSKGWALLRLLYGICARLRLRAILSSAKALGKPAFRMMKASSQGARSLVCHRVQAWKARRQSTPVLFGNKDVVALVVREFDKGGLEEVVLALAENLLREGSLGVIVFVVGDSIGHLGEIARQRGVEVVTLNGNSRLLRLWLRKFRVRLVNLHYTIFGIAEYRRANIPIVYSIQNTYIWADAAFVRERAKAYRQVSRFVAVSEPVREFFASRFQVALNRIVTIPNAAADPTHLVRMTPASRAELGMTADDIFFLNVASFNWHKFHILMVAAMERLAPRLPNARLVFVGNNHGPDCRAHIEKEILRRGLDRRIRILDYAPKEQVIGLMKQADCFLLPSLIEGWSLAVMEAMYCGLPLILSDVGSARTVIQEEDVGIVIRNPYERLNDVTTEMILNRYRDDSHLDNLDDLVAAMERIGRNREEWKRKGLAGREKVMKIFNASQMCRSYAACFQELIAQEKARAG